MAATRADVDRWIEQAKSKNLPFILSVCDTFDWDDYPVYCKDKNDLIMQYEAHNGTNMQRINEIIQILEDGKVLEGRDMHNLI